MSKDELNANTDWVEVLNLIKQRKFSETYPDYILNKQKKGFFIKKGENKFFCLINKEK